MEIPFDPAAPMYHTAHIHDRCICICNRLLRGELSAVETYTQVIDKYTHSDADEILRQIRKDHSRSANLLSANVRDMSGEPEKNSGAWGLVATVAQGAANLFGPRSAIESLLKGEEADRDDYENALLDENVGPECKELIREDLLPAVLHHVSTLQELVIRNEHES
ncbi:DUF2383 domain-containing protein [Luteolibacter yonseiensis]|uniref:DUF2383 domain-containing protein n=1 Tax=Luteolibacter yonseiensis TaxID=1144680 RepID=A0A934VCL0_9BACT|nr:DUF2383 domain-containing protein [Luteolibacter yonseiensis]MBK1818453.1 DUF2383 domain-containing protein [Luteolibacter yonseiensis]